MNRRFKGTSAPKSLILRLRGNKDYGWQPHEIPPPPEIQIEAADELQRQENQIHLLTAFLQQKGLFVEFAESVSDYAKPKKEGAK